MSDELKRVLDIFRALDGRVRKFERQMARGEPITFYHVERNVGHFISLCALTLPLVTKDKWHRKKTRPIDLLDLSFQDRLSLVEKSSDLMIPYHMFMMRWHAIYARSCQTCQTTAFRNLAEVWAMAPDEIKSEFANNLLMARSARQACATCGKLKTAASN